MDTSSTGSRGLLTAGVILLCVVIVPVGLSGTAVALPQLAVELGADTAALQWAVNGFNIAFAVSTLLWGSLAGKLGARGTLRIGVAIYLVSALMAATSPSLPLIAVARTSAGIGGAAIFTGASALISSLYSGRHRTTMFSLYGSAIGMGLAFGPSSGGLIISTVGWRGMYAAHALLLLLAWSGTLLLPRTRPDRGFQHLLLGVRALSNRGFLAYCLVTVAGSISFVTLLTYLPTALAAIHDMNSRAVGGLMLALSVPVLVAPLIGAFLAHRTSSRFVILLGLAVMTSGVAGMLLVGDGTSGYLAAPPALLVGTGFGLSLGLVDGQALSTVPSAVSGAAAGVLNFFRMGSEAVFVALYGFTMSLNVARSEPDKPTAARVLAGEAGHAATYTSAFHITIVTLTILSALTTAGVVVLTRGARHVSSREGRDLSIETSPST